MMKLILEKLAENFKSELKTCIILGCYVIVTAIWLGCTEEKGKVPIKFYAGPMLRSENLNTLYTDSGKAKMRMEAPVQVEYSNGNQEYDKGILITFFKDDTISQSVLKADFLHFNKQQDLYTAIGHVVLEDLIKHERLNTSKLHWSRSEARVFNNEFVEITTPSQVLKGKGITAKQDFSSYTILEPEGRILNAESVDFF
jgi:LPS export ABC transporter protein LptC